MSSKNVENLKSLIEKRTDFQLLSAEQYFIERIRLDFDNPMEFVFSNIFVQMDKINH